MQPDFMRKALLCLALFQISSCVPLHLDVHFVSVIVSKVYSVLSSMDHSSILLDIRKGCGNPLNLKPVGSETETKTSDLHRLLK
jgi:hypothetical protein